MLYLSPPYQLIRGVAVFPDHANPQQFYYLPAMPRLTNDLDPTTGQRVPEIQLLRFTGEAGSGGFLSFAVNLGIEDKVLDDICEELRSTFHLRDTPRLAPAIIEDGRVRLMILGKTSPEPPPTTGSPAPTPPPPDPKDLPKFVLKIDHYAKPALYGDNQAIFSVELDQYGTKLIEESMKGGLMPVGIVYSLDFIALRPAFSFRVTADWDRVQNHFEDMSKTQVFFFSSEIDKVIDKLVEDQVIKIEVDTFIPEGEDGSSVVGHREQMLNDVKDMILDTFFQPSLNPVKEEKDGWDKFNDTAMRLNTLAVTGGWASMASFSYKKADLTRIDQKHFNFKMTERTAVRRSIYPQALLQGLTRVLRDSAGTLNIDDFVKSVNIDDDYFLRRTVTAINRANLEADSIQSIAVSLRYGTQPKDVLLDAGKPNDGVNWASILQNNQMVREVTCNYRVTFKGVDTADRPAVLQSPDQVFAGDDLEINPRGDNLYHIIPVPVTALSFPFDAYPQIEIQLRYNDPENHIRLNDTFILDKDHTEKVWPFFLRDRDKNAFEYKIIFRAKDNRDWFVDWNSTDQQQILLRDPRPSKRAVTVVAAVSWNMVSMVFVDVSYRDETNKVTADGSYIFDNTDDGKKPKVFTVALADPDKRLVNYAVKFLLSDTSLVELPPSITMANQIIVRADMKGHRIIVVQPENVDFVARKVNRIKVDLAYKDDENGLSFASSFTFMSASDKGFFEYDYVDLQKRGYTAQIMTVFADGFSQVKDPELMDLDLLTVKVG